MKVAYLVNQYPSPSHSFVRREIEAVERAGVEVLRLTVRESRAPLVDERDRRERERTRVVLRPFTGVLGAVVAALCRHPLRFAGALVDAVRLGWRSDRGLLRHLAYLAEACRVVRWCRREGAVHLHAHFASNPATVALLAGRLSGMPFSFTAHGPEAFRYPPFIGLGTKIARARFVVAISAHGRSQLMRWSPVGHWAKIHLVRCTVERDFGGGARPPVPWAPRLTCVARLAAVKGLPILIEAVARLAPAVRGLRMVLVGGGPEEDALRAQVRRLGLEEVVVFRGWCSGDEVRQELVAGRALVLPSFDEGLPVVFMEAFAVGRPVVATCVAGVPDLVVPGETGWLVPPGSVEPLVAALREVLAADPGELAARAAAGARRLERQHDPDREAAKLVALFRGGV